MRKTVLIATLAVAAVLVPVAVWAAGDRLGSELDRQAGKWTTSNASTFSRAWRDVPGLRNLTICSRRAVSAMLGVTLEGARAKFRVIVDTPEAPMRPGVARFVPDGRESFAFVFVARTVPFEADDTHSFTVQWRSPSGDRVRLTNGVLNLLYERGTQGCP
jgi:hypothetical protein